MRRVISTFSLIVILGGAFACMSHDVGRAADAVGSLDDTGPQTPSPNSDRLRPVDTTINLMLRSNNLGTELTTAVVPIIGFANRDAPLRFAQISGPQAAVTRVRAVVEVDNPANNGPWQFTALIPVSSVVNNGHGHRVDGVGVTAIITK